MAAVFGFGRAANAANGQAGSGNDGNDGNGGGGSGGGGAGGAPAKLQAPQSVKFDRTMVLEVENSQMTSLLLFHPYESLLVVADDKDGVSLFDYETSERLWHIRNGDGDAWLAGSARRLRSAPSASAQAP